MTVLAPAEPGDVERIATLLQEMDAFYGASDSDPLEVQVQQISEALFGKIPAAYALLAWDGDDLVGIASYSFLWPAVGLTRSLYLKELYVTQTRQRAGVGKQLMRGLFDIARAHGCSRVEWTTDTDNDGAKAFYEALGTGINAGKVFYRLEGDGLLGTAE